MFSVLIMEDERPLATAISDKLKRQGFDVVLARTVEQAWQYLEDGVKVDAVWLDHYLIGKETGLDFIARFKNEEKYKTIPVFAVSNTATSDKRQAYIEFGVDKYFVKADHQLDEIVSHIEEVLIENSK